MAKNILRENAKCCLSVESGYEKSALFTKKQACGIKEENSNDQYVLKEVATMGVDSMRQLVREWYADKHASAEELEAALETVRPDSSGWYADACVGEKRYQLIGFNGRLWKVIEQ